MSLKNLLLLLILFGFMSGTTAREKPLVRVADMYFRQFDYLKAIEVYKRALKKDQGDLHVIQKLADSYRLTNDWVNAETFYAQIVNLDSSSALDKLHYAEALRANQKYDSAKVYYKAYAALMPTDVTNGERLDGIDKVMDLSIDKGFYEIKNLDINTQYSDFGVSFFKDTGIFFCSDRYVESFVKHRDNLTHESFLQIYRAFKDDSSGKISSFKT